MDLLTGDLGDQNIKLFTYEDLKLFTDDFGEQNFIGRTQYCRVYRGKIPQGWINRMEDNKEEEEQIVTVKIWADSVDYPRIPTKGEDFLRVNFPSKFIQLKDEIALLSNPGVRNHPNLAKLMGWCCEIENENVGIVYDLDSYDTLRNLLPGEILKWADRIKITLGLASLLKVLHNQQPQYTVLNISSAHIMIDQDCNPVLLEFGFTPATDVFAFGVLLMELLCKSTTDRDVDFDNNIRNFLHFHADNLYRSFIKANGVISSGTLVDNSLMDDIGFDYHDETLLSMLAVQCVQYQRKHPTMAQVVAILKGLHFFEKGVEGVGSLE